jgi:hypothetical protein
VAIWVSLRSSSSTHSCPARHTQPGVDVGSSCSAVVAAVAPPCWDDACAPEPAEADPMVNDTAGNLRGAEPSLPVCTRLPSR